MQAKPWAVRIYKLQDHFSQGGKRGHNRQISSFPISWSLFTIALFIPLISFSASAQDQPSCQQQIADCQRKADIAIAGLQQQIQNLESQSSEGMTGAALSLRLRQLQQLRDQLRGEIQAKAKCSCTPPTSTGFLRPKYMVLTVVYAPPGTAGGNGASYVDYARGSSTGSKVSTSHSYKNEGDVSLTAEAGFAGNSLSVTAGYGWSENEASKTQVDIKKTDKNEIKVGAPSADGINHDEDQIFLWLNPQVDVAVTGDAVSNWPVVPEGEPMDEQYLYVSELKHPETLAKRAPDLANRLQQLGFTADDYTQILRFDPFGNGSTIIDTNRFVVTPTTFPYEPPLNPTDSPTIQSFTLTNENTVTQGQAHEGSEDVSVEVKASVGLSSIVTATMKFSQKWTWTHSNDTEASSGTSQSATVAVGDPSYGYSGPNDIAVYWDTMFHSFMFAPYTGRPFATGRVSDTANKGVQGQEVLLSIQGRKFRTFTNKRGEYRFLGNPLRSNSMRATIQVGSIRRPVTIGAQTAKTDFHLTPTMIYRRHP